MTFKQWNCTKNKDSYILVRLHKGDIKIEPVTLTRFGTIYLSDKDASDMANFIKEKLVDKLLQIKEPKNAINLK